MAPAAGFHGGTLYQPNYRWRPKKKKKFLPTNQWVFGLKTKKTNKWWQPWQAAPPSDATVLNNQTRINFISKTNLNSVLIQNDKVWVIFWHLQAKLHQFRKYIVMLRTAQATRMFLVLIQIKMLASLLLQFYDAGKTAKKAFAQAYRALEVQQFYVIGIDALKI